MKQKELAKKLEISNSYLSEIESGDKTISMDLLEKYSQVFGIPASTFLLFRENFVDPVNQSQKARAKRLLDFFEWVAHEDDDDGFEEEKDKAQIGTS